MKENLIKIVEKVNNELIKIDELFCNSFNLELISNGDCTIINFLGECIHSTVDNNREYNEQLDEYENLEYFLKKQIKLTFKKLKKTKLNKIKDMTEKIINIGKIKPATKYMVGDIFEIDDCLYILSRYNSKDEVNLISLKTGNRLTEPVYYQGSIDKFEFENWLKKPFKFINKIIITVE